MHCKCFSNKNAWAKICPRGTVESEFELQSLYYIHFEQGMNPLFSLLWLNSTTLVFLEGGLWH